MPGTRSDRRLLSVLALGGIIWLAVRLGAARQPGPLDDPAGQCGARLGSGALRGHPGRSAIGSAPGGALRALRLADVDVMDGDEFEHYVCALLAGQGFHHWALPTLPAAEAIDMTIKWNKPIGLREGPPAATTAARSSSDTPRHGGIGGRGASLRDKKGNAPLHYVGATATGPTASGRPEGSPALVGGRPVRTDLTTSASRNISIASLICCRVRSGPALLRAHAARRYRPAARRPWRRGPGGQVSRG